MQTRTMTRLRAVAGRLRREERGDLVVAPLTILTVMALTAIFAGGVYVYANKTAPKIDAARQGIALDDDGNFVNGAVGVIPVKTPKPTPKPTPEPTQAPRVIERTHVVESDPAPAPVQTQPPVIYVNPGPTYEEPHTDEGSEHTNNTTENTDGSNTGGGDPHGGGGGHS